MPFEVARTTKVPVRTEGAMEFKDNILLSDVGGKIS
jgi:hypothetical protein